ncbi:MAG: RNA-binding domain-containing protein [Methanolinea sp.]|jgi:ATP-dependent DNA helicase RecG
MTSSDQIRLIERLRRESGESEWLEFKHDYYEPQIIGEYLSALANSACILGKNVGYLVFGIDDTTHEVVGTRFDPITAKGKGNQDLSLWLSLGLQPNVGFEFEIVEHPEGRVVIFKVNAAWDRPVRFYGTAYIRVGASKTKLSNHPEKERVIWTRRTDWSGSICERASFDDLDPDAVRKAREQFIIKHPGQASECAQWDDTTFLNKSKLAIYGSLTNAAILLLGKSESATLLSPAVARISWILKDAQNRELDYEHFGPPFILNVDNVLKRIRNLTLRTLPSGTLFPQEISQYDPWVIREALHNCIAHQDYGLRGRIEIVETPDNVILTNVGSFLPGDVSTVIQQDAPLEIYRNPFLAEAMVNFNMIDTQGGGIKRMFQAQIRRYFPLPDYDLSNPERVMVKIPGNILDEQYTRILMERSHLDIQKVMLLDKIQKRIPITREDHRKLKALGLVEGRYPNIFIAGSIAELTGQTARHIRERGFNDQYYMDLILALLREHGPKTRKDIDNLLIDKLPEVMNEKQKSSKVHNLLSELVRRGQIRNIGPKNKPKWTLVEESGE